MLVRIKVNKEKFTSWFCKTMIDKLDKQIQSDIIQKRFTISELYWLCKWFSIGMLSENIDIVRTKIPMTQGVNNWKPKKTDGIEDSPENDYFIIERNVRDK